MEAKTPAMTKVEINMISLVLVIGVLFYLPIVYQAVCQPEKMAQSGLKRRF